MNIALLYQMEMIRKRRIGTGVNSATLGYITDGIVAHFDGIQNLRSGHSNITTTWEDLSGNQNDYIYSHPTQTTPSWEADHVIIPKDASFAFPYIATISAFTLEGIFQLGTSVRDASVLSIYDDSKYQSILYFYGVDYFYYNNQQYIEDISFPSKLGYKCMTVNASKLKGYTDGIKKKDSNITFTSYISKEIRTENNETGLLKIYSLRVYNRVLSDAEVSSNFAIDKNRFNIPD